MSEQLKPCPKCGSMDIRFSFQQDHHYAVARFSCQSCQYSIRIIFDGESWNEKSAERFAVEQWNRRVSPSDNN